MGLRGRRGGQAPAHRAGVADRGVRRAGRISRGRRGLGFGAATADAPHAHRRPEAWAQGASLDGLGAPPRRRTPRRCAAARRAGARGAGEALGGVPLRDEAGGSPAGRRPRGRGHRSRPPPQPHGPGADTTPRRPLRANPRRGHHRGGPKEARGGLEPGASRSPGAEDPPGHAGEGRRRPRPTRSAAEHHSGGAAAPPAVGSANAGTSEQCAEPRERTRFDHYRERDQPGHQRQPGEGRTGGALARLSASEPHPPAEGGAREGAGPGRAAVPGPRHGRVAAAGVVGPCERRCSRGGDRAQPGCLAARLASAAGEQRPGDRGRHQRARGRAAAAGSPG